MPGLGPLSGSLPEEVQYKLALADKMQRQCKYHGAASLSTALWEALL